MMRGSQPNSSLARCGDPAAGALLWERLVDKATSYYVSDAGDRSVMDNLPTIKDYIQESNCTLVDLGPGKLRTAKIHLIDAVAKDGTYAPVDLSEQFLRDIISIKEKGIAKDVLPILADFTTDTLNIPDTSCRAFVLLGSTIGNVKSDYNADPGPYVLEFLTKIKSQMKQDDIFMIGFDACQEEQKILECYNDPYSVDVMLAPLFKIKRDLKHWGNFNPNLFKAEFLWFPESGQCAHTAIALEDQKIAFDDKIYSIPKNHRLHISNSYKFKADSMRSHMAQAGFSDITVLDGHINPMKIALSRLP